MSALVFWKDEHELDHGLKGVIEVQPFDLPNRQFAGARVKDLVKILDGKMQSQTSEGVHRSVQSILLYGSRVSKRNSLENIIPDLAGNSPRLVATMKARAANAIDTKICVETLTGKTFYISCNVRETVSCFKLRVQDIDMVLSADQILLYDDTRLENDRTLTSYGISDGDCINLLLRMIGGSTPSRKFADVPTPRFWLGPPNTEPHNIEDIIPDLENCSPRILAITRFRAAVNTDMIVVIETLTGKKTRASFAATDTVSKLKFQIQSVEGYPVNRQILAFNNTRLEDHRALLFYNIRINSIIYLTLKLNRVRVSSQGSASIPETSIVHQPELSNYPQWRIACEGLNLEGRCENSLCVASREVIIYPNQFESFNVIRQGWILCPMCRAQVKPLTCGFYDCAWKYEGIRAKDGLSISSQWRHTGTNEYKRFVLEGQGNARWTSLLVAVKPRYASNTAKLSGDPSVMTCNICPICWTKFFYSSQFYVTTSPCKHSFHNNCLKKWSKWCSDHISLPSCPVCHKLL